MLKYSFSFLGLLVLFVASGQQPNTPEQRVKNQWKPSTVRVGYDVSRLIVSAVDQARIAQEVYLELDTRNLFVVGEFGVERARRDENAFFESSGFYFRTGIDLNLLPYDRTGTAITLGLRYARSTYSTETRFVNEDPLLGSNEVVARAEGTSSQWLEGVFGLKARLNKRILLGYSLKLRFGQSTNNANGVAPFDIPGFGRSNRDSPIGLQYYIYYSLPFRDKPTPTKPKPKVN